jgi:putative hydrolase of the HAD superfamily
MKTAAASAHEIQAVLLDATGTLIELARPVGEVYSEAAARRGVELPAWRVQDGFERVMRRASPRVFPELRGRDEIAAAEKAWWDDLVRQTFQAVDSTVRFTDATSLYDELFDHYARADAWRLRDGALAMLDGLEEADLLVGVVSNFDLRLEGLLAELGIRSRLACLVLPAHCGARKPDAAIFRAALEALALPAERVAVVGDDPDKDLAGARAVGLRALDVRELESLADLPQRLADLANVPG